MTENCIDFLFVKYFRHSFFHAILVASPAMIWCTWGWIVLSVVVTGRILSIPRTTFCRTYLVSDLDRSQPARPTWISTKIMLKNCVELIANLFTNRFNAILAAYLAMVCQSWGYIEILYTHNMYKKQGFLCHDKSYT